MSVKVYDPAQHVVSWGPYLLTGFDGTFIEAQRDENSYTKKTGVDGEVTRSRNKNRGGTVKLTLIASAASNDSLSQASQLDEVGAAQVYPLHVQDLLGTTVLFAGNAWLQKPSAVHRAKDMGTNEWTFDCDKLDMFVGQSFVG